MPATVIKDAAIVPCWTTFLGSMAGAFCAVDKSECNLAELAGRTGVAFRLNIHPEVCPSGPTALPAHEAVRRAFDQMGCDFDFYFAASTDNIFPMMQDRAVKAIEAGVRRGAPAIVWGLGVPEFGLVTGTDSDARRFSVSTVMGRDFDSKGFACGDIGLGAVPILEVIVPLERTDVDGTKAGAESLDFAVRHARGGDVRLPGYANGLGAYAMWMEALREGRAGSKGMAYNAQVYAESRKFAKTYLADLAAKDLFGRGEALGRAAESYEHAADNMDALAEMFPFRHDVAEAEKVGAEKAVEAVALLERALFWEADGVAKIESILKDVTR